MEFPEQATQSKNSKNDFENQPTTSARPLNPNKQDDFLSRFDFSNEKIINILKSPPGVRQRSVFTANPPSTTKFNVSAPPFVSSSSLQQEQTPTSAAREIPISPQFQMRQPHVHIHNGSSHFSYDYRTMRGLSASNTPSPILGPTAGSNMRPTVLMHDSPSPSMLGYRSRISNREYDTSYPAGPIVLPNGTIQIRLREGVCIDMTVDKAVRVFNSRSHIAMALASNGSSCAVVHPNGKVYQNETRVEIVTYDGLKNNSYVRYAKMWYKGVSFTSKSCALTYLVDTAGTRTTTDSFIDMATDYTVFVFYNDSRHGAACVQEAASILQKCTIGCSEDGTETYELNGFRISQSSDGLVKLTRTRNKCLIRTSPTNGSATLSTPAIHCTASLGRTSHLFVRRGEKRIHFDGSCFIVRNAGHSAGFNEENFLTVY